tara:strand:- start:1633 stop:1821 length:189 start_codon:yes stop_codon:yes gene_type:complete
MSNDVFSADTGLAAAERSARADLIDAYAPPPAPMAMPLQTLEVSWLARLRLVPARPALAGAR